MHHPIRDQFDKVIFFDLTKVNEVRIMNDKLPEVFFPYMIIGLAFPVASDYFRF